jgi:hypothetical protein
VSAPGRKDPAAGDRAIRRLAALAVVTVTALPAAVSYAHLRLAAALAVAGIALCRRRYHLPHTTCAVNDDAPKVGAT